MKRHAFSCIIILLTIAGCFTTSQAEEILRFDRKSFEGWTYTRSTVVISNSTIINHQINLFRDSGGDDYTLISPVIDFTGVDTLSLEVECFCEPTSAGYNATLNSPTFELLDEEANIVISKQHLFTDNLQHRTFKIAIPVEGKLTTGQLRMAAWEANSNNSLSIFRILGEATYIQHQPLSLGDVNADLFVNTGDISTIYSVILGNETDDAIIERCQLTEGDTDINVGDISTLYEIIIGQ